MKASAFEVSYSYHPKDIRLDLAVTKGLHAQAVRIVNSRMTEVKMTQAELAKRMGWTPKHVNMILNGKAEPSMASLDFMCFILDLRLRVERLSEMPADNY